MAIATEKRGNEQKKKVLNAVMKYPSQRIPNKNLVAIKIIFILHELLMSQIKAEDLDYIMKHQCVFNCILTLICSLH